MIGWITGRFSSSRYEEEPILCSDDYDNLKREAILTLYEGDKVLVVNFGHDDYRIVEGINYRGILKPSYKKCCPDSKWKKSKEYEFRPTLSPKDLFDMVRNNPENNKPYSLNGADCQTWINHILENNCLKPEVNTVVRKTVVGFMTGWCSGSFLSSCYGEEASMPSDEYDNLRREAILSLYAGDDTFLQNSLVPRAFKHWILVVNFGHDDYRIAEGINYRGTLMPNYKKCRPDNKWGKSKEYEFRPTLSPKDLFDMVKNNPENYQSYSLISPNCQTWINRILENNSLNPEINTVARETAVGVATGIISRFNPMAGIAFFGLNKLYIYFAERNNNNS